MLTRTNVLCIIIKTSIGGIKMEKEIKEKLHDLIDSIDNEEILEYLYIFIKGKIKAEQ